MAQPILQVENLTVRFNTEDGVVHAVNGVNFHVDKGETVAVVGESGCGKSVSMLSIMRLLPQPPARVQGRVRFQNQDLMQLSIPEMQNLRGNKLTMIFQDPMTSLNPVLTTGYQTMEPLLKHLEMSRSEARNKVIELLSLVGIPYAEDRLQDYPYQFSGGMRQRVMIAIALACNPSLLIADEPTTALDVTIQAQIVELVKELRNHLGMSLIWITHDLGVVAGLANRVLVMYAGYIVEEARVDDLYSRPLHPYTAALLLSIPNIEQSHRSKLETIEGLPPDLIQLPPGCPFAPRCRYIQDICLQKTPTLRKVETNHRIACWVDMPTSRVHDRRLTDVSHEAKD